jgi:hypothetical protein
MAEVKIAADSGGGSVGLVGPASTTGNAAIQLKLPVADGSANQHLKTDGSGNLGWVTEAGGLFSSYALIKDQKSNGTFAGNSVQTTWTQRDLNTETADPDGIVSISSNDFTLGAGSYLIKWEECNYKGNDHTSRLYDVTNSAVKQYSQCTVGSGTYYGSSETQGSCRVTITGDTAYRIEYYQTGGAMSSNGLGQRCNQGDEVYTQVEIYKEA